MVAASHHNMSTSRIRLKKLDILSDNWYILRKATFDYLQSDGTWKEQSREAYDRGNGAAILLYHPVRKTVILTKQFRLPTWLNGNPGGLLTEVCAGLLDRDNPEDCIRRETEEETGFRVSNVRRVFELYMSPGSVTEILYFFIAEYDDNMKVSEGGGHEAENEDIEVIEIPFAEALAQMHRGELRDAKTVILLQYAALHQLIPG